METGVTGPGRQFQMGKHWYRRIEWCVFGCFMMFHNVLWVFHDVSLVVHTPLEFFFQEQSYSSLHSGQSLAWDHVCGDIDDICGVIANFCGVTADPCGDRRPHGRRCGDVDRCATHKTLLNIVKHHETHVKHCKTSWTNSKTSWNT